jgi:MFS family permease
LTSSSAEGPSRLAKATLLAASTLTVMSGATIAPALARIGEHFESHPEAEILVPLILTMPALFIALGSGPLGALSDRVGHKRTLLSGLVVYGVAGAGGLYLSSLTALLISRAVLGLAVGAIMTTSTSFISGLFTGDERSAFLGKQAAFMASGGIVYLLAGGFLADVGWRGPFGVYLASLLFIPGAVLALPTYASAKDDSPDSSAAEPIPLGKLVRVSLIAMVGMLLFYFTPVMVSDYLNERFGSSGSVSGIVLAVSSTAAAVVGWYYARFRTRLGFRYVYAASFTLLGSGMLLFGFAPSFFFMFPASLLVGLGAGLLFPNSNTYVSEFAPKGRQGTAFGVLTASFFSGQFFSPLAASPLAARFGYAGVPGSFSFGGLTAVLIGLSIGVGTYLVRRARTRASGT